MVNAFGFYIGQTVFSLASGYGEVIATEPDSTFNEHCISVKFGSEGKETIDHFNREGLDLNDQKLLFLSKSDAINHIREIRKPTKWLRVFNFYDDGTCTQHINEVSAAVGEHGECRRLERKLIKRHKVEWSN